MNAYGSGNDWDARYRSANAPLFGDAPNAYLRMVASLPGFMPANAVLPADGDGRNGTWLASRGIAVTGFDVSDEATRLAHNRDAAAGVIVRRTTLDVRDWEPEPGSCSAGLIFYLHGPPALRRTAVAKTVHALAPGGWLVLECFARTKAASMGPQSPSYRYGPAELQRWCEGLHIMELTKGHLVLDEGVRHQGIAHVVRLTARRPA